MRGRPKSRSSENRRHELNRKASDSTGGLAEAAEEACRDAAWVDRKPATRHRKQTAQGGFLQVFQKNGPRIPMPVQSVEAKITNHTETVMIDRAVPTRTELAATRLARSYMLANM